MNVMQPLTSVNLYDVIILGSGPAGFTAAIYTSRARLTTLLIAGRRWGGQLMFTVEVENFPGFPEGVSGAELVESLRRQARRFGTETVFEDATAVDFTAPPFTITVGDHAVRGRSVIVATGSSPKLLGLESETRLLGRGVATCATCDAPLYADKKTAVIGGGDSALDEALALAKFAEAVAVIHRRDTLRATKILQERAYAHDKIRFMWDTVVQEIMGTEKAEGLRLKNVKTGEESEVAVDGVFIAIGYTPNTALFQGALDLTASGHIRVHNQTQTSVAGVFAAGDAKDPTYHQAVTAAGDGCKAALDAEAYLTHQQS
jgi:thioredoxin reductase (NADPH)